jgi:ABC-type transporter Mla subunit MlaD
MMAQKKSNEVAVGITVLVVLALTIYIVVALADWSSLVTDYQKIIVKVDYKIGLKGLSTGSPINLGGFKIGQITKTFVCSEKQKDESGSDTDSVCVAFVMKIPVHYQLRDDCQLMPQSNMLGGQAILSIESLGSKGKVISDGETVKLALAEDVLTALKKEFDAQDPDSLLARLKYEMNRQEKDSIVASLVATADNLRSITAKIKYEVSDDEQQKNLMSKVHSIVDRLSTVSEHIKIQLDSGNKEAAMAKLNSALDKLNSAIGEIDALIKGNKAGITNMVDSLEKVAARLKDDIPTISDKIQKMLDKGEIAMDNAAQALAKIKGIVNDDRVEKLINDVAEIAVNLKLTSREVRRAPWKLLYKPKEKEMKIQGLVDSAGAFAAGAERLDSAAQQLKRAVTELGGKKPADEGALEQMLTELKTSFEQFQKAEKKFWEQMEQ